MHEFTLMLNQTYLYIVVPNRIHTLTGNVLMVCSSIADTYIYRALFWCLLVSILISFLWGRNGCFRLVVPVRRSISKEKESAAFTYQVYSVDLPDFRSSSLVLNDKEVYFLYDTGQAGSYTPPRVLECLVGW